MPKIVSSDHVKKLCKNYKTVGQFIRGNRLRLGKSQDEIAAHADIHRQTVMKIEGDKINPHYQAMVKILCYLKSKGSPKFDIYRYSREFL